MLQKSRKTRESKKSAVRKMRKLLLGVLLFCAFYGVNTFGAQKAKAAGATITISTKSNKVTKGDTVYVLVTVSSTDEIKGFEGYFSYDNRVLQFVTGGSVVHGNDDEFQISDMERTSSATKIKYSVKFRARKKGYTTIALKQPYNVIANDDSETKMSVSYNSLDISVAKKGGDTKKKDNALPTASPVPENVKDKKEISQKQEKAELSESSEKPKDAKKSKSPKAEGKGEITKVGTNLTIELKNLEDESLIPAGFTKSEIEVNEKKVTAYVLSGDSKNGLVLLYGKEKEKDEQEEQKATFYLYDSDNQSLMLYDSVKNLYRGMNAKDLADDALQRTIQSYKYVIAIMGVFCALMLLLAIAFRIRYSYKD